ncbi:MAG: hypothetical protein JWP34_4532 [Massilia sp.]|nr:hypothetical protein [Gemmatimonadales bacterium]MDB5910418.1 hypothetical protein [Massilia sp.]
MKVDLDRAQIFAISGALIHTACSQSDVSELSDSEKATLLNLNSQALVMVRKSGADPTEMKNMGLTLLRKVV